MNDGQELQEQDFLVEENPQNIPQPMDQDVKNWISSIEGAEEEYYQATLYKFDNPKSGVRKEMVYQWESEVPSLHEIGTTYGGGRYVMVITFPEKVNGKRLFRSYKFRIHKSYDKQPEKQQQINQFPITQQSNSMNDAISLIKEVVSIMQPMIMSSIPQLPPPNPLNTDVSKIINDVVKDSAKSQLQTYRELMGSMKESIMGTEQVTESEENPILKMIVPLLENYLPMLLASGPQSQVAVKTLQSMPQYKEVVKNKKSLSQVIETTLSKEGKEKTIALLKKLGISPSQVPAKYKKLLVK